MSIDKRKKGGRFEYRARFRYTGQDGKVHQTGTAWYPTKKEAEAAAKEKEAELSQTFDGKTKTWKEVYEDWLSDCERLGKNADNIVRERRSILERRFNDWNSLPVGRITAQMIRERLARKDINDLAVNTKNKYRSILHMVFDFAVRFYGLSENPVDKISPYAKLEIEEDDTVIYSPEDFQKFLMQLDPNEDYRGLFMVIYWLGLRRSEALSLTFGDYDGKCLYIHRAWEPRTKKWKPLKTKTSIRTIRLPDFLVDIFEEQKKRYEGYEGFTDDWFIFGGYKPLSRSTMDRRRKKAIADAGLPEVATNHEMRHSYISNLLGIEENAWLVARSAGHARTETTMRTYAHLGVSDLTKQQTELYERVSQ